MNKKAQIRAPMKNSFILSHNPDRKSNNIEKKRDRYNHILVGENL